MFKSIKTVARCALPTLALIVIACPSVASGQAQRVVDVDSTQGPEPVRIPPGDLDAKLLDRAREEIANETLTLRSVTNPDAPPMEATTDDDGNFLFPDLEEGEYDLVIRGNSVRIIVSDNTDKVPLFFILSGDEAAGAFPWTTVLLATGAAFIVVGGTLGAIFFADGFGDDDADGVSPFVP